MIICRYLRLGIVTATLNLTLFVRVQQLNSFKIRLPQIRIRIGGKVQVSMRFSSLFRISFSKQNVHEALFHLSRSRWCSSSSTGTHWISLIKVGVGIGIGVPGCICNALVSQSVYRYAQFFRNQFGRKVRASHRTVWSSSACTLQVARSRSMEFWRSIWDHARSCK